MNSPFFYSAIFGFALGVFFHSFFDLGLYFSFFIILIFSASFLTIRILSNTKENYGKRSILLFILFFLFFGLGSLRYDISNVLHNSSSLSAFKDKQVILDGVVVDEPNVGEKNTKLVVKSNSIYLRGVSKDGRDITGETLVSEKILISTDLYPEFYYGDRIRIEGKLEMPKNFVNEGEKPFDYVNYLAKSDIYYEVSFAKVSLISHDNGNIVKEKLFAVKNALLDNLKKVLPEPHSSLAGGLLLGGKNSIGKDLENDFRIAGIIHIIVLSGYNIMIVSESIMKAFSFLPRTGGLLAGGISIVLFAIMTGGSSTVVRASFMALIGLLGKYIGRTYMITRALFLAGFIMVFLNPKILVFDFSFQLSFLATLGLIHFSPIVERKVLFITKKWNLREYVVSTIATQLIVLPLLLFRMGQLSLVSLPVNVLVLFLIPSTMFISFVTSVMAFFGTIIAMPFATIAYLLIQYELTVVDLFSKLPGASLSVNFFPAWLMILLYAFYIFVYLRIRKRHPELEKETVKIVSV